MNPTLTRRRFALQLSALGLAGCGGGDDSVVGLLFTAFVLTALIGNTDSGIRVRPTGTGFLSLEPGVAIEIDSDVPVVFTLSPTSVTIATPVVTSRSWRSAGVTSTAAGQFVLTVSLFGEPSVNASIVVNVAPRG
jgi:hypothetical protein